MPAGIKVSSVAFSAALLIGIASTARAAPRNLDADSGTIRPGARTSAAQIAKRPDSTLERFRGSSVTLGIYTNLTDFDRGYTNDYDPYFGQVLSLDPRYKLTPTVVLNASLSVGLELTNSAATTRKNEPLLSDLDFGASWSAPQLPYEIKPVVSGRISLPTSKESRARERWMTLTLSGRLQRTFTVRKNITLTPSVFGRTDWFAATADSLTTDEPYLKCAIACDEFTYSGVRSPLFGMRQGVGVSATFPYKLSAGMQFQLAQARLYGLESATDAFGMPISAMDGSTDWRYTVAFIANGGWQVHKRVEVGLGLQSINPTRRPDSTLRAPFVNRYTQVFLTGTAVF